MTSLIKFSALAALFIACAAQGQIRVEHARIIATDQANQPSAIFMDLYNDSEENLQLAMAQHPDARLELHGTQNHQMHNLPAIELPAHGSALLQRGGLHIMVFDYPKALKSGERFPFKLLFDNGEKLDVFAEVVEAK